MCDVQDGSAFLHSLLGIQHGSAFLLLLSWCPRGVSLPPTPPVCSGGFSLPTTPLMVSRRGQPSSHSPHGVQEGSAFFPLLMVLFRRGQPSPHSPLLYHIVLFSLVHTVTCIGTGVSAHVHVLLRCVHTERKPMRKRSLSHIQLSKKIFVFAFVLARCRCTLIKLGIWCLIFIFCALNVFYFFS